jgi:hypothetical protein
MGQFMPRVAGLTQVTRKIMRVAPKAIFPHHVDIRRKEFHEL